jgi:hypothetical protein
MIDLYDYSLTGRRGMVTLKNVWDEAPFRLDFPDEESRKHRELIQALQPYCLKTKFAKDFEVLHYLGSGTFSTVNKNC